MSDRLPGARSTSIASPFVLHDWGLGARLRTWAIEPRGARWRGPSPSMEAILGPMPSWGWISGPRGRENLPGHCARPGVGRGGMVAGGELLRRADTPEGCAAAHSTDAEDGVLTGRPFAHAAGARRPTLGVAGAIDPHRRSARRPWSPSSEHYREALTPARRLPKLLFTARAPASS